MVEDPAETERLMTLMKELKGREKIIFKKTAERSYANNVGVSLYCKEIMSEHV